ncbi:MAG: TlpA disulfide reductase family protein [Tepidisphaeraceae bacterium]
MKQNLMKSSIAAAVALVAFAGLVNAAPTKEPTLKVGDPAPKLVGKFIQGEPVTSFEQGKLYVVEFWATWCGPCKAQIPHINELHNKYKDKGLVVIGQDVWETEDGVAEPFVKSMGEKMAYRIALDTSADEGRKGAMAQTWMSAAGKNAIPATFIVDGKGTIVWIGHPMDLNESLIEQGLAGKLDAQTASLAAADTEKSKAVIRGLAKQINDAMAAKDYAKASPLIDQLQAALPDDQKYTADGYRVDVLLAQGNTDAATKLAQETSEKTTTNIMFLHTLASRLTMSDTASKPALETGLKLATRTNELLGGKDATSLILMARTQFRLGDQAGAVASQEKVVGVSKAAARPRMQAMLDSYKAGQLPDQRKPAYAAATTRPAAKTAEKSETPAAAKPSTALKVGDKAPAFLGSFIQGEKVANFEPGTAYVVEFWATWCGPCKAAIPHLNDIHNRYKDKGLVVIGQSIWEQDDSLPAPFVKAKGDAMAYRIAVDDKTKSEKGAMADTWVSAAGQSGIPCTFLIDKTGTIAWIGHPSQLNDEKIGQVLAGTFDVKASAVAFNEKMAEKKKNDDVVKKVQPLLIEFTQQLNAKDWDGARATYEKMTVFTPQLPDADKPRIPFQELRLFVAKGDVESSITLAKKLINDTPTDSKRLNVTRTLMLNPVVGKAAAVYADEQLAMVKDQNSSGTLSLRAQASFLRGDAKVAVKLQEQAVAVATPQMKARYETTLKNYQSAAQVQ